MSQPTDAAADYLMTIRYMQAEGQPVIAARWPNGWASAATVSEMVNRLTREGLLTVDETTRQLELTDDGRATAERTFRRHALAEWLLTEVVGLGWAEADEEAHHLQHALSERVNRIDDLLGHPPTCPMATRSRDGRTPERPAGIPLSEARAGEEVTILRVTEEAEEDARLLTFLQEHSGAAAACLRWTRWRAHRHHDPARPGWGGDPGPDRGGQAAGLARPGGPRALPPRARARAARRRRSLKRADLLRCGPVTKNRNRRIIIASIATVLWLVYMVVGLALINYIYPTVRGEGPRGPPPSSVSSGGRRVLRHVGSPGLTGPSELREMQLGVRRARRRRRATPVRPDLGHRPARLR